MKIKIVSSHGFMYNKMCACVFMCGIERERGGVLPNSSLVYMHACLELCCDSAYYGYETKLCEICDEMENGQPYESELDDCLLVRCRARS